MTRIGQKQPGKKNDGDDNRQPVPEFNMTYRRLSTAPLVGFYILQNGCFSFVNEALAQLLGCQEVQQILTTRLVDWIHPDDRSQIEVLLSKDTTLLESIDVTFRIVNSNSKTIHVNLQGQSTIYNEASAYMGCITDLSSIDALKRYRDKYETSLNEVGDAVAELDLGGNLTFYTDAVCRMYQVSKTEYIGKNYREFIQAPWAEVARNAYHKVYQTGLPEKNIIYQIARKDGKRIYIEDTISAIRDQEDNITGFRTISRDITAHIATEQQMNEDRIHLEAIFRSVDDAVIAVDPQMHVVELNSSVQKICGLSAQNIKGKPLAQGISQCSGACYEALRQTVEKQKRIKSFRIECNRRHHPQMVSVNCAPLISDHGIYLGAVMIIRDVTVLRDLERELGQREHYLNIIGKSKSMQALYRLIEDLADQNTTVLITGESGTGKEMVAKALHHSGQRALKPFVAVNCSALPDGVIESELFGHVKGAFTGAVDNKQGRFEAAHGGTLLIDEVGDMTPHIQLKLLRVLQEKEIERVGDTSARKVDLRIISCTNRNLKQKVANGDFRQDLFFRLNVIEIHLPPLRERREDIPLLVDYFCRLYNNDYGKQIQGVTHDVMTCLMSYDWPGNVRELKHAIESAFVICDQRTIELSHMPIEIQSQTQLTWENQKEITSNIEEKKAILQALKTTHWNKSKAAKRLGYSRQTLYKKMNKFGIIEDADQQI